MINKSGYNIEVSFKKYHLQKNVDLS
jgi:hypothetical protein